jgi:hypothetical protein
MGIAFKDTTEMAKAGIILDPNNPNAAVPVAGLMDLQPDSSWSDERLIEYGQRALNAVDKYEEQATILTRKSIVRRFQAGHALSLLKSRHRNQGTWVEFQSQHNLPRTVVWETIAVYERVVQQGHREDDVAQHATWAAVMIAYGVKRNHQEEINNIPPEVTYSQPDAAPSKHGKRAVANTPPVNRGKRQLDSVDNVLPESPDQDEALGEENWENGSDEDSKQEEQDGHEVAAYKQLAESLSFTDDELKKARDYIALFEDPLRAMAALDYVILDAIAMHPWDTTGKTNPKIAFGLSRRAIEATD